jgi:hypothetical protein
VRYSADGNASSIFRRPIDSSQPEHKIAEMKTRLFPETCATSTKQTPVSSRRAHDTATGAPASGPARPRQRSITAGSETGAPLRVIQMVAVSKCPCSMMLRLFALLPMLLLIGCLEFEDQTLTYRYDLAADTLRIFQDYHGIFGADDAAKLKAEEEEQLDSVLKGQRTFFFANWILEYNREQLSELLQELKDPQKRKEMTETARTRLEKLLTLAVENVRVENNGFYFDAKGRLCGSQKVTVTHVAKLIAAGNDAIREMIKAEAAKPETSAEERAVLLKAEAGPGDFIRLQGSALTVRVPMTARAYAEMMDPGHSDARLLTEFRRQGGGITMTNDLATFSLGAPTNAVTALTLPMAKNPYVPNAVDAVRKRASIREKFDPASAARAFLNPSPAATAP